jgi:hypothetical protein
MGVAKKESEHTFLFSNNEGHLSHSFRYGMFKKDEVFIALLEGELELYTCTVTDRPFQTAS